MNKIAFYTVDLCSGREHLMPWRTILEIAKRLIVNNNNVIIINACYNENDKVDYIWNGIYIKAIDPGYHKLSDFIKEESIDVLFMEIKWRDGLKNWKYLHTINCKKIAYFTGGVYNLSNSLKLLSISNYKLSKPYIIESLVPKNILCYKLKRNRFDSVIGLTDYTAQTAKRLGINNVYTIYPGKDEFEFLKSDDNYLKRYNLINKKFLLFTGAPIAFRGSSELIKAIDRSKIDDIHLVMLIRADKGTQHKEFLEALHSMKHRNRITIIDNKLNREQLKAFFEQAYYAVLPFIVIPSEIPLTYFEIMSCGTPIISFNNGGTTKYLEDGLVLSGLSNKCLINTLEVIWNDEEFRKEKSLKAIKLMKNHPSWDEISNKWRNLI